MATIKEPLRYFEIKVGLRATLEMFAGKTPAEAAAGRYKTRANAARAIFEEVFQNLAKAVHDQARAVDVTIKDDKWIVQDPS